MHLTLAKDFTVWNEVWQLPGCEKRLLPLSKHFIMKRENVAKLDPRQCPQHSSIRLSEDPEGKWENSQAIILENASYEAVKGRISGYRGLRTEGKENDRGELISQRLGGERTVESVDGVGRGNHVRSGVPIGLYGKLNKPLLRKI